MNPNQEPDQPNYPGYQGYPPPPPGYQRPGYPQPTPGYPGPANQGFMAVVQDLFRRWQTVITGRSVPTFDAQLPSASWQAIWIGLLLYGLVRGITGAISSAVVSTGSPAGSFFGGIFGAVISFFIGVGILYLIAKMFNGSGTFLSYAYLLSLVIVPLGIASAILGLIPIIGAIVGIAIGIFEIYLAILATVSAHRLPLDRATWVVLIPVIVGVVLVVILFAAAAAALVALGFHF